MEPPGIEASQPSDAVPATTARQFQVIATTDAGTRAALLKARQLARRLALADIVLVVPRLASSIASIDAPETEAATIEKYRRIASVSGVDVTVRLCVCETLRDVVQWMVPRGCIVVLGGQRRWWWPTREQRIADMMKRIGHRTVFAEHHVGDEL
jgi:hypothetical protein